MRRLLGVALVLVSFACAQPGTPDGPEDAWKQIRGTHLYVWPRDASLALFTCRWETDAPIGYALDASEDDRTLVTRALEAWQSIGIGVRFHEVRADEASLWVAVHEEPVETAAGPGSGRAIADCRIEAQGAPLVASIESARVDLARQTPPDLKGATRPLTDAEFVGTAFHELGHALGFQGHSSRPGSALQRERSVARRLGGRILSGETVAAPEVVALYKLPSGSVARRVAVERWRTDLVDRMARLASEGSLSGPYARVGDSAARVFWRASPGREYGLQIPNLEETIRRPEAVLVIPEALTRSALPRSRDRRPDEPNP